MALDLDYETCDVFWCQSKQVNWYGIFTDKKLTNKGLFCKEHGEGNAKRFNADSSGRFTMKEIINPSGKRRIKRSERNGTV